jgi:hypothetical protein
MISLKNDKQHLRENELWAARGAAAVAIIAGYFGINFRCRGRRMLLD